MECLTCGRRVFLDREEFEKRVKEVLPPAPKEIPNVGNNES